MKNFRQILSIIHTHNPSILPTSLLTALLKALLPFCTLLFSSPILNCLLSQKFQSAAILAFIMLGIQLIVGLLLDFLEKLTTHYGYELFFLANTLLSDKAMSLDYASLSTHQTQKALSKARETLWQYGSLSQILDYLTLFLSNIISLITSCILVVNLCLHKPTVAGFECIASVPVTLTSTLGLLLILIIWNYKYRKKDEMKRKDIMDYQLNADVGFRYLMSVLFSDPQVYKSVQMNQMAPMLIHRLAQESRKGSQIYTMDLPLNRKSSIVDSLHSFIIMLLSYGLVILKILSGAISIGSLIQYTGAITQFSTGSLQLIHNREQLNIYLAHMSFFLDFLNQEDQFNTGSIPVEKRQDNVYELEFHNVSFSYPGTDIPVLKNVSCKLNLKQKMAVVGPNGAGKSTFIKLLCRLYDPTSGYITLNGVDIRKYNYSEYTRLFGIVFQDYTLFPYSIAENIAVSQTPDRERVWKCLNLVEMQDRIQQLPKSIDTPIYSHGEDGDGVNFSGGELQKLSIARALYKDAPLVILDEPTAALDPISEYEIYSHFDTLVKDKTSIFISHRMSSCRFCEDILVFDHGVIAQRGSHDELLRDNTGLYNSLWTAQAQYYEM